jgi:hypothetical protein
MQESENTAGDGPAALCAPTGPEDRDVTRNHLVPAAARLHTSLATCEALIAKCAEQADNSDHYADARIKYALAAGRLAAAQAVTVGGLAKLADAEGRQRLTNMKMDDAVLRPRRAVRARRTAAPQDRSAIGSYDPRDWENDESGDEKSTFNSPDGLRGNAFAAPRIRSL